MDKGRTLVEIRTGEEPTEKVIQLGEFMAQHEKRFQLPLYGEGCIIVKKLGYLKRIELDEGYTQMCAENDVDPVYLQQLRDSLKAVMKTLKKSPKDEENNKILENISKEVKKYKDLIGEQSLVLLIKYISNIVVEPEELQDPMKVRKWLEGMEMKEFIHISDEVGNFLGPSKKNSPSDL